MFVSNSDFSSLAGRYIFVDNDFLGFLFEDEENLDESLNIFPECYLTIDPFVRLEFLRDIFVPNQRDIREKFISYESVFQHAESHHENFIPIQENALLLSKVYAHQRGNGKGSWSTVDLLLAGRSMLHWNTSAIITGNKKDFP